MKLWQHYTNDEFFRVLESKEFIHRFYGRCHPIYRQNGGIDFYNPDTLRQELARAENELQRHSLGRNHWVLSNRVNVVKDWLKQSEWILDRLTRAAR